MLMCGNCFSIINDLDDVMFDPQDYQREDPMCVECAPPGWTGWFEMIHFVDEDEADKELYDWYFGDEDSDVDSN